MGLNWKIFPKGWGFKPKMLGWRGVDIFWNNTLCKQINRFKSVQEVTLSYELIV